MLTVEEGITPNEFVILEDEAVVVGKLNLIVDDDDMIEVNGVYKDQSIYFLLDNENDYFMIDDEKYVIIYDIEAFNKAIINKIKEAL